jgi:acetyl-CoA decarbonylase/synthase, CODH/ACS complex subunit delta
MTLEIPKETYKASVFEVTLGNGPKAFKVGGENAPAFHLFEGAWPNLPKFALEIYDAEPTDWAESLMEEYGDVLANPVNWARKCVDVFGAEAICLKLASTSPTEKDTPAQEAAKLTKEVAEAIGVPLIVYGTGSEDKDVEVLTAAAEAGAGKNLMLGPLVKKNFDVIARAAQEFGHGVILQTALEIPEAKELNLKLTKTFPPDRILYDPLSPALGYGMEYGYSVMERMKLAGTSFGDVNLRMPLVANIGAECWEIKEAKEGKEQGLIWEALTCLTYILGGANLVIVRHPKTPILVKKITQIF